MDTNFDSNDVPSLTTVVEEIFSSCDKNGKGEVYASALIEFMKPHISNHLIGLTQLLNVLDPKNENPLISRTTFYEAMRSWTAKMNEGDSKLLNFSFKDTDVFNEKGLPFHRSTPKPSLEPTTMNHSNNSLDFSNLSPTSFTADTKDISSGMDKLLFIEERYQELEYKHLNTIKELSLIKSQLATSEEQYAELKQDFDRTNKRLMLEQQVNADLQKSMDESDEFKEEVCNTKKEKEHLHKMWILTKRENVNLIAQMKNLEYERESLERKLSEIQKKDEQKKKEFVDLQTLFSIYEDENKLLKKTKSELEEELQETKASLEHYTEVSELGRVTLMILKNKVQALTQAYKRKGIELNDLNLMKDPSILSNSSETSLQSESSLFETIEDLDLSSFSDNLLLSSGQDLLSELQECKFLDNHNKCFIEEHAEMLKIVKEHENCSQIIADKEKQIELMSSEIKTYENKYNTLLNKYTNEGNDMKCLEAQLKNAKTEYERLLKENNNYKFEIANLKEELNKNYDKLQKMIGFETKNTQLIEEINRFKEERKKHSKEYDEMKIKKDNLQLSLDELVKEKDDLLNEKNNLFIENRNLTTVIEIKGKELTEMQNLKVKNEDLENEIISMRLKQKQDFEEIEKLSDKLQVCKNNGKFFMEKLATKIRDQNAKLGFLRDFNEKLQEYADELKNSIEIDKKKLHRLISYVEENFFSVKYVPKGDDEDSTSTASSESSSHHRSKRSSTGRKSNFDKQEFKINKLEEKIEELEKELQNEKAINENLKSLDNKMNNLEMEKINYEEEKRSILRELEATKYDLSIKDQMIQQFEEKHKFDLDNLKLSYEKELQLAKVAQNEASKRAEIMEMSLMEQIEDIKKKLNETQKEKELYEIMLEKQENKIITLKKTLSDISNSTEETKNFEILVTEKESMLKFNREMLCKSNNSLKQAENRCLFLELLLDKCRMVLLDTVSDVLRSTIEVFNSHRNILEKKGVDPKLIQELEILDIKNSTNFTEEEVWIAHNQLTLTSKLLKSLVSGREEYSGCSNVDIPSSKSISKFTLRPSKLKLLRLPSCDPDISSSMKDNEVEQNIEIGGNDVNSEMVEKEEPKETENKVSIVSLSENDSITNWLGPYSDDLRKEMNNRKVTEKKFTILSSTWKSNFNSTKKKYRTLKHQCSKMKDTYLHVLLQIVTHLKDHDCQQEQLTLIHTLRLIEKLKDLLFDIFKLAEQYGASRQELHSIKCWNLIVEYVNKLHQENGSLKLYQCTSVQITEASKDSVDNSTETTDVKKSFRSVGVGNSIIDTEESAVITSLPVKTKTRKCSSFMIMSSTIVCLLAMCILFIHMECVRNGNETIICPLDLFISIKKAPTEPTTY
ncbi:structural maintenance of chromosomes protein 3 homolog isoform X4 [Harmonia axyridis]|uniref:structural maintenance of chromosomes protein 3 homolog isoform X4 n=1 Tax=Harmonia axyridis TaxID=115357 RepID=UPI001E274EF0|nr:structural maintenance of chromosomes protein 3 homolog isoform X4 [Harmonia axyridis]